MSQFTKMLEPSPPKNYEQTELGRSILSPVAFPAKMYHVPALEKALKTAMDKLLGQGCGENTQESLANLDQNGLWLRMCEGCCQQVLISDREETSELFSGTWPTWGLMRSGRVTVLKPLVRRTKGKESLLWPTARANKIGGSTSEGYGLCLEEAVKGDRKQNWPTPRTTDAKGPASTRIINASNRHGVYQLREAVQAQNWSTPSTQEIEHAGCELTKTGRRKSKNGDNSHSVNLADTVKMWRTPDANLGARGPKSAEMYEECKKTNKHALNLLDQVKHECNWPTSRAREGNSGEYGCKSCERNANKFYLDGGVKQEEKIKGQLNADWVEILMGLPINWTNAEISNGELKQWPGWPAPMGAGENRVTPQANASTQGMEGLLAREKRNGMHATRNLTAQIEVSQNGQYSYEPPRVIEGQKNRAKRLKCLGNGCVPMQVYPIFKIIMEVEKGGHK